MNTFIYIFIIVLSGIVLVWASPATQCEGYTFEGLQDRIEVNPCGKTKCRLRKGTNTTVTIKFRFNAPVKSLTNDVNAVLFAGIPLPFIGVHGTSACGNIFHEKDRTPASCPLEADTEYIYTNVFHVESYYPEVNLVVRWSLKDGDKKVICFEIPAVISKAKQSI